MLNRLIYFCLNNKFIVILATLGVIAWGVMVAPFDWDLGGLPRDPVPVDAIPDIGENQQIVFTDWAGRSPQDVEDQVTYPLTVSLLGVPNIKTVRSYSMFGFSTIYVIFEDDVDFYWSRTRVLEKLNSLPAGTLPEGVQPTLGPDSTALGQIFLYTLEGRDEKGNPAGGWGLDELRSVQDWYVRYALLSAKGISEVASVGGFVREYQVDVDPDAMRAHGVTLDDVYQAVRMSNSDVGARGIEVNKVEYLVRGLGFLKSVEDIEKSVIKVNDNVPIRIKDIAHVTLGPALRRGALDKGGAEAVGGVVVVRYGDNPLAAIKHVKAKIEEIAPGLPSKAVIDWDLISRSEIEQLAKNEGFHAFEDGHLNQEGWKQWLKNISLEDRPDWITLSKVTVVPYYDRTGLIYETLGTLNTAIYQEILITIIVVLVMVRHLGSSGLISGLLPLAVLMTFIAMRQFGVDANVVALSGIVIAIGTMVDMGVVISENILRHLEEARTANTDGGELKSDTVRRLVGEATTEIGGAVLTAVATTVVGFLPVFTMVAAEGKLFKPLAYTKTFALIASIIVALTLIPPFAHLLFSSRIRSASLRKILYGAMALAGVVLLWFAPWWAGTLLIVIALFKLMEGYLPYALMARLHYTVTWLIVVGVALLLSQSWLPLGPERGLSLNFIFVAGLIGGLLLLFYAFQRLYAPILRWALIYKRTFLSIPLVLILLSGMIWLGFDQFFGWLPSSVRTARPVAAMAHRFPGLGKEFMPPLDEGSYLFMPTTMAHASIGEALDVLQIQNMAIHTVPEVDSVVGKLGRAESPLDPAPIAMFETIINYKPQYLVDRNGRQLRFKHDPRDEDLFRNEDGQPLLAPDGEPYKVRGRFERDAEGRLVPDRNGAPFRLWRPAMDTALNTGRAPWPGIQRPDDIWEDLLKATELPGTTSAPRLQPIAARIVMLQSGMRAPMGVKVKGPDLETIERVGLQLEKFLKQVPSVEPSAVIADRVVGQPYLEIVIDRDAISRYGLMIQDVQDVIEVAIGGKHVTTTVEGRERYPVRVRYLRELRDQIETLGKVLVSSRDGAQIPLSQLADIRYVRGPQEIKSEDTRLVSYVVFDMQPGFAEVDVVEQAQAYLKDKIASGEFVVPSGVSYSFAGSYENQVRASRTLMIVVPLALFIIFIILYLQFHSVLVSLMVFSGIFVAWSGGFLMLWAYAQDGFLNFAVWGVELRELFQIQPINLSVAVWVGFLALFGIASDNGVLVATILQQRFEAGKTDDIRRIREVTVEAAQQRVRPALMTTATTILALLPVLTSTGRGSDIMVPMAIPSFGGMTVALVTMLVVPVLYSWMKESSLRRTEKD